MGFLALVIAGGLTGYGSVAGAEQSKAQNAADAAALAGAGYILDDLPDQLLGATFSDPGNLQGDIDAAGCGFGEAAADDLAAENDATVTDYCWSASRTEVSVTVRLNYAVKGKPATASAVAAPGLRLSDCQLDPNFVPPTTPPSPPPAPPGPAGKGGGKGKPSTPPQPPAPVDTTVDCPFGDLAVSYDPTTQRFSFSDPGQLRSVLNSLKPRLVS